LSFKFNSLIPLNFSSAQEYNGLNFLTIRSSPDGYDKEVIERLQDLQLLDEPTRAKLFDIMDTYIRDAKARQAYS